MKSKLLELLEYNFHSNHALINACEINFNQLDERTIQILNHILNSNQIWNARILNETAFEVWQVNPLHDLNKINENNYQRSQFILNEFDLKQILTYKNAKGLEFKNSIEDILFHIINHSTYHRGQIALKFRECELEPLISDYIFYKR